MCNTAWCPSLLIKAESNCQTGRITHAFVTIWAQNEVISEEMLDHLRFTKPRISKGEQTKRERAVSEWQRLKELFVFIIKEALIKGGNKTNTKQKIITTAVAWKKNTRTDTTLCYLDKQQQSSRKGINWVQDQRNKFSCVEKSQWFHRSRWVWVD